MSGGTRGGLPLTYDQWVRRSTGDAVPPNSDGLLHVGERAALIEQLSYLKKRNAQLMKQQRAVLLAACEAQAAHAQCADFAGELMREKMQNEQQKASARGGGDAGDAASVASEGAASTASGTAAKKGKKIFGVRVPSMRKKDKPVPGGEYEASASGAAAGDGGDKGDGDKGDEAKNEGELSEKLQRLEHENTELLRKTSVLVDYVRATAPLPRGGGMRGADADDDAFSDDDDDDDADDDLGLPPKDRQLAGSSCLPEPVLFDEFAGTFGQKCKWESFMSGIVSAFGAPQGGSFPDEFDT